MSFPPNTPVTSTDARALFQNALSGRGIALPAGLSQMDEIAWAVGALLSSGATFAAPIFTGTTTAATITATGNITSGDTFVARTTGTLATAAAAETGTLDNAPVAGDPAKWVKVIDGAHTYAIPAWEIA